MGMKRRHGGKRALLLRGINVGGHHIVPMAELRSLITGLGASDVETYIQSGNVIYRGGPATGFEARVSDAIDSRFGFRVSVLGRSAAELDAVTTGNPFVNGAELKNLHVAFLAEEPAAEAVAAIDPERVAPDQFALIGRELFLHCPNGMGRSKLSARFFDAFGPAWTVRNWRTVGRLAEMASA